MLELDYDGEALRTLAHEGDPLRKLTYLSPARVAELAPGPDQTEAGSRSGV
jgi:hypothetical protein